MKFFVRAVMTGFAMSLGSALFKKVSPHLGLDDSKDKDKKDKKDKDEEARSEPTPPPDLSRTPSDPGLVS